MFNTVKQRKKYLLSSGQYIKLYFVVCSLYANEYVLLKELAEIFILCNQCNYKLINNCNIYVLRGCVQFYVRDM